MNTQNNQEQMRENATKAAKLLKLLANESRLMILCQLIEGEKCVGEMLEQASLSQSALSQHLAKLRQDKLVNTRKVAQTVYYRLADDSAIKIIETLHRIYCNK